MATNSKKRKKSPGDSPATVVEHLQQLVLVMDGEVGTAETRLFLLHSDRILQAAKGSLVERRALASKETGGLGILCRCLELAPNLQVTGCMLQVLDVLADHKYKVKLVETDCVHAVLASFVGVARQGGGATESAVEHLKLLLKLAPKDKRFCSKARWCGAVSSVHSLLGSTAQHTPAAHLMVVLQTVRTLATNSVNVRSFCKLGTDGTLVKLLQGNKLRDLAVMKCAADCLAALLRQNKAGATKSAQSAVKCLIPAIEELHRLDRHNRHSVVLLSLVACLKAATESSTACKELFRVRRGHAKLLPVVEDWNEGQTKALTDLATAGCALLRLCLPEEVVPVPTFSHVLHFPLPEAALANGSSREQEDDVEHSEEEDAVEGEDQSDVDGLGGEGALDEGLTHEEELALCTGDSGLQLHVKVVSGASQTQGVELTNHGSVEPALTEASPGELHACQEPGRDGCRTGRVTAWQGGDGLLFAKSQSSPPPTSQHLLTTGDSEGTETGLQYGVIPEKEGESGAIPEKEGEGQSGSMLPLQPPSSENSDACLTPKTSPNLSACSSSSALPGKDADLSQFDHFFPELSNESSRSDAVVLDIGSGHRSQEERGEEEEEVLTVESISTSELLTAAEGSQLSVSSAEETIIKEEGRFLEEAPPPVHSVDVFGATPPFVAYKESHPPELEPQYKKPAALNRKMELHSVWRYLNTDSLENKVVYDLHSELQRETRSCEGMEEGEEEGRGEGEGEVPHAAGCLTFDARFESGNLMRAVKVQGNEYDLLLNSDINSDHYHRWFCFKVTGMVPCVPYVFNIINFETPGSQFKQGMQPVLFSVKEAETCGRGWVRAAENVTYFANKYKFRDEGSGLFSAKKHRTATFSITFPHSDDVCYLAFHYPYLYTDLMTDLLQFEAELNPSDVYYRRQTLCSTLKGNACPIITVTSKEENPVGYRGRDYIVLSARVHPGEANSSWVMRGVLRFLVGSTPSAVALRRRYIFKVIPMLNPDGVINGSTRCSLAGCDLNRRWIDPDPVLHPTIYHTKGVIDWLVHHGRSPYVYCDLHGHSQIKNVVLFACPDPTGGVATEELPRLLSSMAPLFNLRGCTYKVQKSKEAAARVVVWRMGVVRSYTMEASYCGANLGKYKGYQVSPRELEEMGQCLCEALLQMGRHLSSDAEKLGQPEGTQERRARSSDRSQETSNEQKGNESSPN